MQEKVKQKILIADDERFNLNILVDILKPDYRVIVAKDGKQALYDPADLDVFAASLLSPRVASTSELSALQSRRIKP